MDEDSSASEECTSSSSSSLTAPRRAAKAPKLSAALAARLRSEKQKISRRRPNGLPVDCGAAGLLLDSENERPNKEGFVLGLSETELEVARRGIGSSVLQLVGLEDLSLSALLSNARHFKVFVAFAEGLHCSEVVLFWWRVNEYRRVVMQNPYVANSFASQIWACFLSRGARWQVGLSAPVMAAIEATVVEKRAHVKTFCRAQAEAYYTMQISVYPHFSLLLRQQRESVKTL